MTQDQSLILVILLATIVMFLWGRWRHDMVAGAALLACVLTGLVEAGEAFTGFSHPAVVTVACVLVLSRGLQTTGAVDILAQQALPKNAGVTLSIAALTGLGALLSGFMNNVGAMALLMPVAMQLSGRLGLSSGQVLMPLAFGTILGGMTTLIGTPPNLIVSGFRSELAGENAFSMFDFTLVGLPVAVICVLFVALVGWRLVPIRKSGVSESFDTGAYVTEVRIPEKSKAANQRLGDIEKVLDEADAQVIALVRNEVKINAPGYGRKILAHDILVIEADVESLGDVLASLGLELEEAVDTQETKESEDNAAKDKRHATVSVAADKKDKPGNGEPEADPDENKETSRSADLVLVELVVREESGLVGRSAKDIFLRSRYGINLLALSREDRKSHARLRRMKIKAGDVLLMQGAEDTIMEFASDFSCIPLAERELIIPDKNKAITASLIFITTIALAALGILPTAIAFAFGVLASMVTKTLPLRSVYSAIDWPVIVLLGALIPVANVMETTGAASLISNFLLQTIAQGHSVVALGLILVVTMLLSGLMNNAATAAVMCPIAIGTAATYNLNPDAFLMAVAIGASCAFLTPIGHQNNTLILGPGGFRFGDYWRLGLPVELLVCAVSLPLLLIFWPL